MCEGSDKVLEAESDGEDEMISLGFGVLNEQKHLPYLVPFLQKYRDEYDEAIFSVESTTTDDSLKYIWDIPKCRVLIHDQESCKDKRAVNYNNALNCCLGDWLFVLAPDLLLDPLIFRAVKDAPADVDVVTFRYWNYGLDISVLARLREEWDNSLKKLLDLTPGKGDQRTGLMAIRRRAWVKTGGFKDCPNYEEQFLLHSGLKHLHCRETKILHLHSGYSREKQLLQGRARREAGFPLWKTVGHSLLHFKPYVLVGYLQESSS